MNNKQLVDLKALLISILFVVTVFTMFLLGIYNNVLEHQIMTQKNFILNNATYKCTKTNELKEGI